MKFRFNQDMRPLSNTTAIIVSLIITLLCIGGIAVYGFMTVNTRSYNNGYIKGREDMESEIYKCQLGINIDRDYPCEE